MDALDAFIGKWQEEKKEGFEDLAEAIGRRYGKLSSKISLSIISVDFNIQLIN